LLELRVLCEVESDDAESPFPLVMAMKFASRDHIAEALDTPTRGPVRKPQKSFLRCLMGMSSIRFLPLISLIQPLYRYGNLVAPALIAVAMSVSEHLLGYLCEACTI
jgi:hypothetical protein